MEVDTRVYIHTHTHTHIFIYTVSIYIFFTCRICQSPTISPPQCNFMVPLCMKSILVLLSALYMSCCVKSEDRSCHQALYEDLSLTTYNKLLCCLHCASADSLHSVLQGWCSAAAASLNPVIVWSLVNSWGNWAETDRVQEAELLSQIYNYIAAMTLRGHMMPPPPSRVTWFRHCRQMSITDMTLRHASREREDGWDRDSDPGGHSDLNELTHELRIVCLRNPFCLL